MTYTFRQGDLPKLDLQVDRGTDFQAWKTQWEAYLSLSALGDQAQTKQVQALTLCFTRETLTVVGNLGLSAAQRGNVKDIVAAIQSYVEGHPNTAKTFLLKSANYLLRGRLCKKNLLCHVKAVMHFDKCRVMWYA